VQELPLDRVRVEQARLEDLVASGGLAASFDGFTSRATLTLGPTLRLAAAIVVPGGSAFLWKGTRRAEEMAASDLWREHWDIAEEQAIGDGTTNVVRFLRRSDQ
jgi:16S rRNA G527 N7-methylase RsmG